MTEVTILQATNLYGIECSGHSGYAEIGSDIVCAGISALTDSFLMVFEEYLGSDGIELKVLDSDDGYMHILYYDPRGVLKPAFTMLKLGLSGIEESYPYNINLQYKS